MKKCISIALSVLLLCLSFAGCVPKEKAEPDTRPVLKVGMECAYVPYNWESYNDSFDGVPIQGSAHFANGYDTKIAAKIAEALDYRLVIVKLSWNELLPAVRQGKIDLAIGGISPQESEGILFSSSYYQSNIVVVVKESGDYCHAESINDFQDATVAAQSGTVHETLAGQMPNIKDECLMADYDTMIAALQNDEIDAYIAELPVAQANCKKYDGFMYVNLVNNETGFETDENQSQVAVAMQPDSPLAETVDKVLNKLSEDDRENLMNKCIKKQP
ncbi:MAG: transporter substrate-binding domain-containing protein [Clostridia bacterium]|nr:transporter substrate-binding domain-containing protein [Clostridia bacterium]